MHIRAVHATFKPPRGLKIQFKEEGLRPAVHALVDNPLASFQTMPRRPKFELQEVPGGYLLNVPASMTGSGLRERYVRADRKEAEKLQAELKKRYHQFGIRAGIIAPRLAGEAAEASDLLKPFGVSVIDAAREFVRRRKAAGACVALLEAWQGYEARLLKLGRSEATLVDYRRTREYLPASFLALEVAGIEGKDIERGLDASIKTKPVKRGPTWNRRLRETKAVLNWARNTDAKAAPQQAKAPEIIENEISRRMMAAAEAEGCALPFALMLFAGIRPQGELGRISWGTIGRKYITLSHEETKTATDRQIPILPNLRLWLNAHKGEPIIPPAWQKKRRAVRRAAGISGQDILRHTFGSNFYRLHTEEETKEAMGHHSIQTFLRHYKRAVTVQAAQGFFTICPAGQKVARPPALRVA